MPQIKWCVGASVYRETVGCDKRGFDDGRKRLYGLVGPKKTH